MEKTPIFVLSSAKQIRYMTAIRVNDLRKSFDGAINAVDHISFDIPTGEIFGFLGPNGSGKTTCIRLINGILTPSAGSISIFDKPIEEHGIEIHSLCGVMTENAALYENMTAIENLYFFGHMHRLSNERINERSKYLLTYLELDGENKKKVRAFSSGMKKKLSLAIAMLHNPDILFLDEPTAALDPESAKDVLDLIRLLAVEEKKTVFLCSHQLRYIEHICTIFGFLKNGKLLASGTFETLCTQVGMQEQLLIRGNNLPTSPIAQEDSSLYLTNIKNDTEASQIIEQCIANGGHIYEARRIKPQLEEMYFKIQHADDEAIQHTD